MARKKGPQVDQAFAYIRDQILSFALAPRAPVSDYNLAAAIGMSRAPVREALLRLEAEGLVERINGKLLVSPIDITDIIEIFQVREAVEIASVQIAMADGALPDTDKQQLREVYRALTESEGETDFLGSYAQDDLFHAAIVNCANNRRLTRIADRMRLQMQRARWLNVVLPDRHSAAADEHRAIYSALMADDLHASINAIRAHLDSSLAGFRTVFSNPDLQKSILCIQNIYQSSNLKR